MILTKVRFKNFFSAGNDFIEIDLLKYRKCVVTGQNGMGKSTILSAITFALFGKTIKAVNKPQIINSINNKACVVEVEGHMENGTTFLVRRGIKPNVFEIFENGELVDQTVVGEYQDYLEQKLIRTSFRTFTQTSILSVENYKPFMAMSAADRRAFIEDILDIRVFSVMDTLTKTETKKNKEALTALASAINSHTDTIDILREKIAKIEAMKEASSDDLKKELAELEAIVEKSLAELEALNEKQAQLKEKTSELKELRKKRDALKTSGLQLKGKVDALATTLDFFESNDVCPTCQQPIETENVQGVIDTHTQERDQLMKQLKSIAKEMQEYATLATDEEDHSDLVSEVNSDVSSINTTVSTSQARKRSIERKLAELSVNTDTTEDNTRLSQMEHDLEVKKTEHALLKTEQEYNQLMTELFKDSGIKSKIVEQFIPVINTLINEYLERMDFFVSFELDSEFNETIKSRHRDTFTYNSFSAGEKQRIDLAIMFSMRQLAVMKNSFHCNLLCCDEVLDAAVDEEGVGYLNAILMSEEFDDTNLIVVSHRNNAMFADLFDGKYTMVKRDGFTQVEEE